MITTAVILGIIAFLVLMVIMLYNRLVGQRALVREAFSGITVQLRRRADLIPNLVEAVKGYATHERETFEQISANRGAAVGGGSVAATAQADMAMTGMLGRLMAVAEAYPQLKADANFRQLQDQLSSVESEYPGNESEMSVPVVADDDGPASKRARTMTGYVARMRFQQLILKCCLKHKHR